MGYHSPRRGRDRRCGWRGPWDQVKNSREYHAKEFDLWFVDTETPWEMLRMGVTRTKRCFREMTLMAV